MAGWTRALIVIIVATDSNTIPPRYRNGEYCVVSQMSRAMTTSPAVPTHIWRLFGDSNADNTVDMTDFTAFRSVFNLPSTTFDFDNNGTIDTTDFTAFRARFNTSI